jgi:hypothetical protein
MRYCDVLYGGRYAYGMISSANASLCISNCRINYSGFNGIDLAGFAKIDSTTVMNCVGTGIFMNAAIPYCPVIFDHDSLISNNGGLITSLNTNICSANPTPVIVQNCYFDSNTGNTDVLRAGWIIKHNKFINNSLTNEWAAIVNGGSIVECNEFINNHSDPGGKVIKFGGLNNNIVRNNYFEGNTSPQAGVSYEILDEEPIWGDTISIYNNTFRDNMSPLGSTIELFGSVNGTQISTFYIHHNNFINEQFPSNIYLYMPLADFNLQFAHISNNNFLSPGTYAIQNYSAYGGPNIDADSNYWGSISNPDSLIYDYFDNSNSTVVYYSPILTSTVQIDTTCPSFPIFVSEISLQKEFSIYPNPAHNTFTISLTNQLSIINSQLKIYDMMGRMVMKQPFNIKYETLNTNLSPGLYFVQLRAGENIWTQKLVIE